MSTPIRVAPAAEGSAVAPTGLNGTTGESVQPAERDSSHGTTRGPPSVYLQSGAPASSNSAVTTGGDVASAAVDEHAGPRLLVLQVLASLLSGALYGTAVYKANMTDVSHRLSVWLVREA